MAETKQYKVQNLGAPCRLEFPRIVIKGELISKGRGEIKIKTGDVISLEDIYAEKLVKTGILKEIKEKAVK